MERRDLVPILIFVFMISGLLTCAYYDYKLKERKLDLIEKGVIKSCVELVDINR